MLSATVCIELHLGLLLVFFNTWWFFWHLTSAHNNLAETFKGEVHPSIKNSVIFYLPQSQRAGLWSFAELYSKNSVAALFWTVGVDGDLLKCKETTEKELKMAPSLCQPLETECAFGRKKCVFKSIWHLVVAEIFCGLWSFTQLSIDHYGEISL